MGETYRCPDGREVLLTFNADTLRREATVWQGETIGIFNFELVGSDGETINVMLDTGGAVSLKLAKIELVDGSYGQGIIERVVTLVSDEINSSSAPTTHAPLTRRSETSGI